MFMGLNYANNVQISNTEKKGNNVCEKAPLLSNLHPGLSCVIFIQNCPGVWASKPLQSTGAFIWVSNFSPAGHWIPSSLLSHW